MFAKEIKRFIEIVDKGSLNLAAKYLNISQPAISNSVKILEKKYNTRLFERNPKGLILTEEGKILYKYALNLVDQEKNTLVQLKDVKIKQNRKILRIGSGIAWNMLIFPSFFTNIIYDDSIQYNFKYGVETILLPELKEDKIDLVFGIEPNFRLLDPIMEYYPFLKIKQIFYAKSTHKIHESKNPINELNKYPLLSWSEKSYDLRGLYNFYKINKIKRSNVGIETSSLSLGISTARKSEYLLVLPDLLKSDLKLLGLLPLKIDPLETTTSGLIVKQKNLNKNYIKQFLIKLLNNVTENNNVKNKLSKNILEFKSSIS